MTTYRGTKIKGTKPSIERNEDGQIESYIYRGKRINRNDWRKGEYGFFSCRINGFNAWYYTLSEALIDIDKWAK